MALPGVPSICGDKPFSRLDRDGRAVFHDPRRLASLEINDVPNVDGQIRQRTRRPAQSIPARPIISLGGKHVFI
jgi:hypothetical protein